MLDPAICLLHFLECHLDALPIACEYRFTIHGTEHELPVHFVGCVVPDNLRDVDGEALGLTVEGHLLANDTFEGQFKSSTFGFFLRTADGQTFFSEDRGNRGRSDQMYAYGGNGDAFGDGPLDGSVFATSMYLLAFEGSQLCRKGKKTRRSCGDADFKDFVVTLNSVAPIPIPSSAPLLGAALALLTIWRRRGVADSTSK